MLRTMFNYDRDAASLASGLLCLDKSRTQQAFAEEVDINTIVRRFGLDGKLPESVRMPTFGDFSEVIDFQTAMNAQVLAREAFDAMPAGVRARFHNDPQEFVEFCSDDANAEEAGKLGLVRPDVLEARQAAAKLAADKAFDDEVAKRVAAQVKPQDQLST